MLHTYIHTYIISRPFPFGVGRDHFLPLATIFTNIFRFFHCHQIPHTRSPVSGTPDLLYTYKPFFSVSCGVRDKINEWHLHLSSMDIVKGTLEIDGDGLTICHVSLFLIFCLQKSICGAYTTPSGIKREWYVCNLHLESLYLLKKLHQKPLGCLKI
jgi:hypothetical protein